MAEPNRREEILAQIDRCRHLERLEKDPEIRAAIARLKAFYEAKLAVLDGTPAAD